MLPGYPVAMDAITLLKNDHQTVEALFKRFEKAGDRAFTLKRSIIDKVIAELSTHAAIEEELFYPVTRSTVPDVDDMVLEAVEEHHIVKWVLSELEHMDPREEAFDAKVTVLIENVRHHVEEEEGDYFPKVRKALGRKDLSELGDAMEVAKSSAPTRPHPRSPSTPPANIVVNNAAGVADRIEGTVSGVAAEGAEALRGALDRLRGQGSKKRTSPGRAVSAKNARTRTSAAAKKPVKKVARAASDEGKTAAKRVSR
jgi:hemerythrin superfamily protein